MSSKKACVRSSLFSVKATMALGEQDEHAIAPQAARLRGYVIGLGQL